MRQARSSPLYCGSDMRAAADQARADYYPLMTDWIQSTSCYYCDTPLIPYRTVISAPALTVEFCCGDLPVLTSSTFVICPACGLVAQSPRMSDERIEHYYSSGLYRMTLGISTDDMDADEKRRALDVAVWLDKRGIIPSSHTDVGMSRGFLLQEVGADIQGGYDVNPNYATLEVTRVEGKFELVTSIHVLEHTINPMRELEWYKSLSTDYVMIEVPGINATGGALRFAHLWYFPPKVLAEMMERAGMKIVEIDESSNTRILGKVG